MVLRTWYRLRERHQETGYLDDAHNDRSGDECHKLNSLSVHKMSWQLSWAVLDVLCLWFKYTFVAPQARLARPIFRDPWVPRGTRGSRMSFRH